MSKAKTRISFNDIGKNHHKTLDVDVEVWAKVTENQSVWRIMVNDD